MRRRASAHRHENKRHRHFRRATLGRRKARLTVSRFDPSINVQPLPVASYRAEPFDFSVSSYPGVFSASQLDQGTRFFLQQFDAIPLASSTRRF